MNDPARPWLYPPLGGRPYHEHYQASTLHQRDALICANDGSRKCCLA